MVTTIKKFICKYWFVLSVVLGVIVIITLLNHCGHKRNSIIKEINNTEYVDSNKTYHKIYQDNNFKILKKENRELYDSLKKYKKEINYLNQFRYKKTYTVIRTVEKPVRVEIEKVVNRDTLKVYEYRNNPNDSLNYTLKIGSYKRPEWYELKTTINEKFTIVNKTSDDGTNHITIESENKGDISNVTTFNKKHRKKFWERFKVGPSITVGYDPLHKNFGMTVGAGLIFDITK